MWREIERLVGIDYDDAVKVLPSSFFLQMTMKNMESERHRSLETHKQDMYLLFRRDTRTSNG